MDIIGGISGATLGYITKGMKGAKAGYKMGRDAGKSYQNNSMPPIRLKRGRIPSKKFKSTSTSTSSRRRGSVNKTRVDRNPGNARTVVTRVKRKNPKLKKSKKVKISSGFRKKVDAALAPHCPKGYFSEIHFGMLEIDSGASTYDYGVDSTLPVPADHGYDKQWLYGRTRNTNWNFENFTFPEFMDAVGVLFFNRIKKLPGTNYEARHKDRVNIDNGLLDSKFSVVDSSVSYHLKNNSRRSYEILVYTCVPKQKVTVLDTHTTLAEWFVALQNFEDQDQTAVTTNPLDLKKIGIPGWNGIGVAPNCTNVTGVTPNHLNVTPFMSPRMTSRWKIGVTKMVLEPGQEHSFVRQGPKNVMFKAQDWRMNISNTSEPLNYAQFKPGWSESMFFVIKPELLTTGDGGVGRFGDVATIDSDKLGIAIQCTKTFSIRMPEITGTMLTIPASAVDVTVAMDNLNRKPSYYFNTWRSGSYSAAAEKVDAQNPIAMQIVD